MSAANRRRGSLWRQLPLLIWLVVLWLLLWERISVLSVASGLLIAILVMRFLYLPAVELSGRFNPYRFLVFAGHFVVDVVVASVQVAAQAFDPRRLPRSSVLAVSLHTNSDLLMTLTGQAVSLVPGSIVVEVDRAHSVLYLHALGVSSDAAVEKVRRTVLATEERLVRAFGSREDIMRVNAFRESTGRAPISRGRRQREYEVHRRADESQPVNTKEGDRS